MTLAWSDENRQVFNYYVRHVCSIAAFRKMTWETTVEVVRCPIKLKFAYFLGLWKVWRGHENMLIGSIIKHWQLKQERAIFSSEESVCKRLVVPFVLGSEAILRWKRVCPNIDECKPTSKYGQVRFRSTRFFMLRVKRIRLATRKLLDFRHRSALEWFTIWQWSR